MTTPIDPATVPLLPTKDTLNRLRSFSDDVYDKSEGSVLYRFMDALAGDSGAGSLKKELLIARLTAALDTTYFTDLDNVFGNLLKLARLQSETYYYDPSSDLLTTDQWDEIRVKDAWYRARIKNFFIALNFGGTPDGLRMMVKSAVGTDSEIYEVWRFQDHYADIYGVDVDSITNFIRNPSFELGTSDWSVTTAATGRNLDVTSAIPAAVYSGNNCLFFTTGTSVTNPTVIHSEIPVIPNKAYTASAYIYNPTANVTSDFILRIRIYNSSGTQIYTDATTITPVRNTLTRLAKTTIPPSGSFTASVEITGLSTIASTSDKYYIDAVQFTAGTLVSYFDGDTPGYRWTGTPRGSASTEQSPIDALSRLKVPSREEVIVYPYKSSISNIENVTMRTMLKRVAPVNSVISIASTGMPVNIPIDNNSIKASSTYFYVQRYITGAPGSALPEELFPNETHRWVTPGVEVKAPTYAFGESQEYSQYYILSNKNEQNVIDTVTYTKIDRLGVEIPEKDFQTVKTVVTAWGPWISYMKADSPDNFPGGRLGLHPATAPAVTKAPPHKPYKFPYKSQAEYIAFVKKLVSKSFDGKYHPEAFKTKTLPNGQVTDIQYRYPMEDTVTVQKTWGVSDAVSNSEPVKASTVSANWYAREPKYASGDN